MPTMPTPACCICASYISSDPLIIDESTEKPVPTSLQYPCCSRRICRACWEKTPRFANYCPYCQHTGSTNISSPLTSSPVSSIYSTTSQLTLVNSTPLPTASSRPKPTEEFSEKEEPAPDVLHFVNPAHDTIGTLSIRYGVPATVLRQTNSIFSDHLLAGRKTILISGDYYKGGVSLSPVPIDGEAEDMRKGKIRKWMMACKVVDYEIAEFYLSQVDYDLEIAIMAYKDDEKWEKEHPLKKKGKGRTSRGLMHGNNAMSSPIRW